jgi:hypothetical protein
MVGDDENTRRVAENIRVELKLPVLENVSVNEKDLVGSGESEIMKSGVSDGQNVWLSDIVLDRLNWLVCGLTDPEKSFDGTWLFEIVNGVSVPEIESLCEIPPVVLNRIDKLNDLDRLRSFEGDWPSVA